MMSLSSDLLQQQTICHDVIPTRRWSNSGSGGNFPRGLTDCEDNGVGQQVGQQAYILGA